MPWATREMEFGRSGKELGMLRMCECEREGGVNHASVQFGHLTTPSAYPPHALWSGDPQRHALELWKPGPQPSPQPWHSQFSSASCFILHHNPHPLLDSGHLPGAGAWEEARISLHFP